MDFQLTQEQRDLKDLAAKIFKDLVPADRLPRFEEPRDWFDEKLWGELGKASLLAIGIPEASGGAGMGLIEACVILEEAGKTLAPVPLLPHMLMGVAPVVEFGTEGQKREVLPAAATGKRVLTAALLDTGSRDPLTPTTRAKSVSGKWHLDGSKDYVPAASVASTLLVSAVTGDDAYGLFLVDRDAPGVSLEAQATTTGELEYRVALNDVTLAPDARLGKPTDDGRAMLEWTLARATIGVCATELGVAERALRMTADYTGTRKQFGKPIATFQAVAQRAADAYIDLEAMRLSTMQAMWRLATGLQAERELAIAKFWTSEGGHRVCYASQHLHGGIGVDTDYPLHHYYLRSRHLELTLGGTHTHLARSGDRLAAEGPRTI